MTTTNFDAQGAASKYWQANQLEQSGMLADTVKRSDYLRR